MKFKVGDVCVIVRGQYGVYPVGSVVNIVDVNKDGTYNMYRIREKDLRLVKRDDTQVKHHAPIVYRVYETLKQNVGEENAISATDLCRACGISSHRELREIIREMRRSGELEKIPCSCNKGYYMASTKEEAMSAIERLINTAKNEFKTGYIMMKKLGLDKQMKIPLGEYFKDTYHSLMEIDDETDKEAD